MDSANATCEVKKSKYTANSANATTSPASDTKVCCAAVPTTASATAGCASARKAGRGRTARARCPRIRATYLGETGRYAPGTVSANAESASAIAPRMEEDTAESIAINVR